MLCLHAAHLGRSGGGACVSAVLSYSTTMVYSTAVVPTDLTQERGNLLEKIKRVSRNKGDIVGSLNIRYDLGVDECGRR